MIQETTNNIQLAPPVVPLLKLREPPAAPVPPPVFPGKAAVLPPAPPIKGQKKERRMELVGLEGGDPRTTYHMVILGIKNLLTTVPRLLKAYWKIILVVLTLWWALASFDVFYLCRQFPKLSPLWLLIDKFILILVFLTAAYNNFIAKAVYAAVIIRVGLPLFGRVRAEGFAKVVNDFKQLIPGFKENSEKVGAMALGLVIGFGGIGAFVSNYLTRNNKIDKIAVSIALAMALMKALSDGHKSLPFMAGRVMTKDIFVLLLKPSPVRNHHIYVAISGLALGLLCCLPFAGLVNMTTENIGYITGTIAMVAGAALVYMKKDTKV